MRMRDRFLNQARGLLRQWREAEGWTQRKLATELGVSPEAIVHLERGASLPALTTAIDIQEITGIACAMWKPEAT
jgi:DNA-binding XRE family transcriptional regulator